MVLSRPNSFYLHYFNKYVLIWNMITNIIVGFILANAANALGFDMSIVSKASGSEVIIHQEEVLEDEGIIDELSNSIDVPFYSQLEDISDPYWKGKGCGIASLAMIIDFFKPNTVTSVDNLLREGINAGAYLNGAGWIHAGLIDLSRRYGFDGQGYYWDNASRENALSNLRKILEEGPVIASVYYTFDPLSPIPHLVVINDIDDKNVYYNDPAEPSGGGIISIEDFQTGWKQRIIAIRPR